jgi:hypothetical protein
MSTIGLTISLFNPFRYSDHSTPQKPEISQQTLFQGAFSFVRIIIRCFLNDSVRFISDYRYSAQSIIMLSYVEVEVNFKLRKIEKENLDKELPRPWLMCQLLEKASSIDAFSPSSFLSSIQQLQIPTRS